MKNTYKQLMAKSDREFGDAWLPLWMHLKDTAGVMKKLVHRWIPLSVIKAAGLAFEEFEKAAVFAAGVHDIGKAISCFQYIITENNPDKREEVVSAGFTVAKCTNYEKTLHAYAGQCILSSEEIGICLSGGMASVVGAHHGKPSGDRTDNLDRIYPVNFYGAEKDEQSRQIWRDTWDGILSDAMKFSGINSLKELPELGIQAQVLLTGLLITADWIASNTTYFPLIGSDETGNEELYPKRVIIGFEKIRFPEIWNSECLEMDPDIFMGRFGFSPNRMQRKVMEIVRNCSKPGIFILEANMGSGKTEAALAATEMLAAKTDAGGVFFGLPTQATSNGIFPRLYNWAASVSEETENAVRLAHGAASFNPEYEKLLWAGRSNVDEDGDTGLSVHPWFQGNKKALLADFVIGTVDQFLMASLKRKHFMLRHLGLAGKIVVIDECHAYDAYMNIYLDRTIEWMAAYGVPVILLSATLPPARRQALTETYLKAYLKYFLRQKSRGITAADRLNCKAYPLLTWTDGEEIRQSSLDEAGTSRDISMEILTSTSDVIAELNMALKEGGCACIILNTVKKAQEMYEAVKMGIPEATVLLYHAQFTMNDRAKKENDLLRHMGKKSDETLRYRYILIGTQVLEQSLDYDADIMVSQLCPVDLLFQRMGRLHRHERKRPEPVSIPRMLLLCENGEPFDEGSDAVYGEYLLRKTWRYIKDLEDVSVPKEVPELVRLVYDMKKEPEGTELFESRKTYDERIKDKESRAHGYLLEKPPSSGKGMKGMLDNQNESADNVAESSVRDSGYSIEVLLLKEDSDGNATGVTGEGGKMHINPNQIPDISESKFVLRQKIRLPKIFSQPWNVDETIRELEDRNRERLSLWQQSPMLKGELVLFMNSDGETNLGKYRLSYDTERGLRYGKQEVSDVGKGI